MNGWIIQNTDCILWITEQFITKLLAFTLPEKIVKKTTCIRKQVLRCGERILKYNGDTKAQQN